MSKTFKMVNTTYDVTAQVVIKSDSGFEVVQFNGEGSATKNARSLKKTIVESYEQNGCKVVSVGDITTTKRVTVTVYQFDMTSEQVLSACIAYAQDNGIAYKQVDA